MPDAYIYARISADLEGDAHGVASQLRQCEEYATAHDMTVAGQYVDNDISAYHDVKRPEFERLLTDMEAGLVPTLIVWHIDRLCRRVKDLSRVVDAAKKGNTRIITLKAGDFDLSTASGEMVAYLVGTIAQFEARHSSERQVASQHDRALKGIWRGGRAPFGYISRGKGTLEVDEEAAGWLHQWRRWLSSGESLLAIVRKTREAVDPTHQLASLSPYGLRNRLSNPAIAGLVKEHGEIVGKAQWPAIFTEDEYEAVLSILRDPARRTNQGNERKHQGSGTYRCGVCGYALMSHKHPRHAQPKYHGKRVYICRKNHISVQAETLDEFVNEVLFAFLSRPENQIGSGNDHDGKVIDQLRVEQAQLAQRKDDLGALFAAGDIDRSQLVKGTRTLAARLEKLGTRLDKLAARAPIADLALQGDQLRDKWETMSADKRATILQKLFTITIMPSTRWRQPIEERVKIERKSE